MTEKRRPFGFYQQVKESGVKKNEDLKPVYKTALESVYKLKYLNTRWQLDTEQHCFLQALQQS